MGEDLPKLPEENQTAQNEQEANQPQQIEVNDGGEQQPSEVAVEANELGGEDGPESEEPQHLGTVNHDEDGGRWDKQKAETMAGVLQEEDELIGNDYPNMAELGNVVEQENAVRKDPDYEAPFTKNARIEFERREVDSGNWTEKGIEAAKAGYEDAKTHQLDDLKTFHQEMAKEYTEGSDITLSPYEELYDLNPDKFANMPTSEFMKTAKEFSRTTNYIKWVSSNKDELDKVLSVFKNSLEKGEDMISIRYKDAMLYSQERLVKVLNPEYEERQTMHERLVGIMDGEFDKTPRQIVEAKADFLKEYMEKVNSRIVRLQKSRQDILDAAKQTSSSES